MSTLIGKVMLHIKSRASLIREEMYQIVFFNNTLWDGSGCHYDTRCRKLFSKADIFKCTKTWVITH